MITATQAQELFCKKILNNNESVFSQIDRLIVEAIHNGNSRIIIKYTSKLSKDINDNILEVFKIHGYHVDFWYVHKIVREGNGNPCIVDEPAGYVISWKV